jgi:DNA-binding GntR family transcriptional regulator
MPHQEAKAIAEHRSIVETLNRRGSSDRAVRALTDHLDDAYKRSLAILEQHADMVQ